MNESFRIELFRRWWSGCTLLLVWATWQVWIDNPLFPQVPVHATLGKLPGWVDAALMLSMLLSLVGLLLIPARSQGWRSVAWIFFFTILGLACLNQMRFQVWAYQAMIVALVLATCTPRDAGKLLRWLTISIYAYSAWSKVDVTFLHSLGKQLAEVWLGWARFADWPPLAQSMLISLVPLGELAVAVLLAMPRTRKVGVIASLALHALLLLALGPWGLQHKPGVLLWNVFFMGQNVLLFWPAVSPVASDEDQPSAAEELSAEPIPALALVVVVGAIVWPLTEPWGYCDHWPAWSVYAPRVERTSCFIAQSETHKLPTSLQEYLEPASDDETWLRLRLDRWSLDALSVPLYPQNRVQLAVAAAVIEQFDVGQFQIVRFAPADRWTQTRKQSTLSSLAELTAARQPYVLGTQATRKLKLP
jgi:hypothetical protein